jgi:hypothetical protein
VEIAFPQAGDFVRVGLRHLPRAFLPGDVSERRTPILGGNEKNEGNNQREQ